MTVAGDPRPARRFLVRGRVQGVGFRYFVVGEAQRLGLGGFTRNLPDGTVEVQAAGAAAALEDLARALERGPALSRVDGIVNQQVDPDPAWTEFRISH